MPRVALMLGVGAVHHVIARFVDRSWELVGEQERVQYLTRLSIGMRRAGWQLIGYALMSNHVHLLTVASGRPLEAWAKRVHVGMAQWLNRRFGRLGPVFAGRPYCEMVSPEAVPIVLAYLHNHPVRARVVACAADSTWTSHRAYLGLDVAAGGLDVSYGLQLSGFIDDACGRLDFADWVAACARAKAEGNTPPAQVASVLRTVRVRLGSALELGTATRDSRGAAFVLLAPSDRALQRPVEPAPADVIGAVFAASGVNLRDRPTGRPRAVSRARRAALQLRSHTRLPRSRMARVLGLSPSAASQLLETTPENDPELTSIVAKATELLGCGESVEQFWLP